MDALISKCANLAVCCRLVVVGRMAPVHMKINFFLRVRVHPILPLVCLVVSAHRCATFPLIVMIVRLSERSEGLLLVMMVLIEILFLSGGYILQSTATCMLMEVVEMISRIGVL